MAATAAAVVPAAIAWACVAVVSLTVSPQSVQPGGTVAVTGKDFAPGAPIEIHLDSPTGRLLTTVPPHSNSVMMNTWTVDVPIPADTPTGQHVLFAVQDYHNMNAGVPARATLFVGTPAVAPATDARPTTIDVARGPSVASLLLIGLGATAAALLLAGVLSLAASRRPPQPEAEPVKTS